MSGAPSLTLRLLANLLLAQIVVVVALWIATSLMSNAGLIGAFEYSLADIFSPYRIRDYVIRSLAEAPDGSLYIEPVEELRAEQRRTPGLQYAAFRSFQQEAVPGSSPELAAALQKVSSVELRGLDFYLPRDGETKSPGAAWRWRTRHGPVVIGVSGYSFVWTDPLYSFVGELGMIGFNLSTIFVFSGLGAWLAVRRGLAPLRRAAAAADGIDMDTIGQGVPAEGAPREVAPLIHSINKALSRLDASAARMRRYTASAAHELRTPLAVLDAHIEDPEGPGYKIRLKRDVARMRTIVDQILVSARLNEGQSSKSQTVDIVKTTRSIVGDHAPLAHKAGQRIEFEAFAPSVTVRGNRQAIECIAANLVDNALHAEPADGVVIVQVGPTAMITVIDHGAGVDDEDKEKVFEPFWRKDETRPGSGLGLSITKELVADHGGRIWVEETSGGGATFKALFPPDNQRVSPAWSR